MRRGSNYWFIQRKDVKSNMAVRKRYKDTDEWWCYRRMKSNLIDPFTNKPFETKERYLFAIIVCLGNTKFTSDKPKNASFTIVGERYTNDKNSNDLDHYLTKTNRGHNG